MQRKNQSCPCCKSLLRHKAQDTELLSWSSLWALLRELNFFQACTHPYGSSDSSGNPRTLPSPGLDGVIHLAHNVSSTFVAARINQIGQIVASYGKRGDRSCLLLCYAYITEYHKQVNLEECKCIWLMALEAESPRSRLLLVGTLCCNIPWQKGSWVRRKGKWADLVCHLALTPETMVLSHAQDQTPYS